MPSDPAKSGEKRNANGNGSPPMQIEESYRRMSHAGRRRLRIYGGSMMLAATGLPLVGGLFVELSPYYWIFSGVVVFAGLCLVWPQMGLWLVSAIPSGLAKILPSKMLSRPDRRNNGPDDPEVPK